MLFLAVLSAKSPKNIPYDICRIVGTEPMHSSFSRYFKIKNHIGDKISNWTKIFTVIASEGKQSQPLELLRFTSFHMANATLR
jgi:hypothetical protein